LITSRHHIFILKRRINDNNLFSKAAKILFYSSCPRKPSPTKSRIRANSHPKPWSWARRGQTSDLQRYVAAGIPANLTNGKGDGLLMLAAYHGHAQTVSMLLGEGARVDGLNDAGQSPLAGAVFKGYGEVVKVLVVDGKADLSAGHPNALDCARMFKREAMLKAVGVEVPSDTDQ
jgi:ankyrin repeat protein